MKYNKLWTNNKKQIIPMFADKRIGDFLESVDRFLPGFLDDLLKTSARGRKEGSGEGGKTSNLALACAFLTRWLRKANKIESRVMGDGSTFEMPLPRLYFIWHEHNKGAPLDFNKLWDEASLTADIAEAIELEA